MGDGDDGALLPAVRRARPAPRQLALRLAVEDQDAVALVAAAPRPAFLVFQARAFSKVLVSTAEGGGARGRARHRIERGFVRGSANLRPAAGPLRRKISLARDRPEDEKKRNP